MKVTKKITLLVLVFAAIQSLYAQKQPDISWQIGLNIVPLFERIVDGSAENPFLPTPTNLFLLKRINNQKNNALRFSADLRFRRETQKIENRFSTPYQLKFALLTGYEKRFAISDELTSWVGASVNPVIVLNPISQIFTTPLSLNSVERSNTVIFYNSTSLLSGFEYRLNRRMSVAMEGSFAFTFEDTKGGFTDITWENPTTGLNGSTLSFDIGSRKSNIQFQPIFFLNLNINIL
jgi:hypothetical protein